MRRLAAILFVVVSACASDPVPEGYTGPLAAIRDSVVTEGKNKAEFFFASEIDGKLIHDSLSATESRSYGKGFHMEIEIVERDIPVRPMRVKLEGRVAYSAPILKLAHLGSLYSACSIVEFEPVEGHTYIVKGKLTASASKVWLEDMLDGQKVGRRIQTQ